MITAALKSASEPGGPPLSARGLVKRWEGRPVLSGLDLDVGDGEVVAIVAPNGSGKTTLFEVLAGVTEPDSGAVVVRGRDVTRELSQDRGVFYVPQSIKRYFALKTPALFCFLPGVPVRENLLAQIPGASHRHALEVDRRLHRFGLLEYAGSEPAALSAGLQQRLALARALGSEAPVLLLDEPLASVDRKSRLEMLAELRKERGLRAILYITHDDAEAEALGARRVTLRDGRIHGINGHHPPSPPPGLEEVVPQLRMSPTLPTIADPMPDPPPAPVPAAPTVASPEPATRPMWSRLGWGVLSLALHGLLNPPPDEAGIVDLLSDLRRRARDRARPPDGP